MAKPFRFLCMAYFAAMGSIGVSMIIDRWQFTGAFVWVLSILSIYVLLTWEERV